MVKVINELPVVCYGFALHWSRCPDDGLLQDHVAGEALKKGLNAAQEAVMLAETLEHNGLPQINNPVTNTLANVAGGQYEIFRNGE